MASTFAGLYFPSKKGEQYFRLQSYTDPEKNPSPVSERRSEWEREAMNQKEMEKVERGTKREK